jgi:hypothetical protein
MAEKPRLNKTEQRIIDWMRARDEKAFPVRFYYGAGGQTAAEQRRSRASAKRALKLQYPWR